MSTYIGVYAEAYGPYQAGATQPVSAPTNLRQTDGTPESIMLAWDGPAGNYTLQRAAVGTTSFSEVYIGSVANYTDDDPALTPDTRYAYRVRVTAGGLNSAYSATITAATLSTAPVSSVGQSFPNAALVAFSFDADTESFCGFAGTLQKMEFVPEVKYQGLPAGLVLRDPDVASSPMLHVLVATATQPKPAIFNNTPYISFGTSRDAVVFNFSKLLTTSSNPRATTWAPKITQFDNTPGVIFSFTEVINSTGDDDAGMDFQPYWAPFLNGSLFTEDPEIGDKIRITGSAIPPNGIDYQLSKESNDRYYLKLKNEVDKIALILESSQPFSGFDTVVATVSGVNNTTGAIEAPHSYTYPSGRIFIVDHYNGRGLGYRIIDDRNGLYSGFGTEVYLSPESKAIRHGSLAVGGRPDLLVVPPLAGPVTTVSVKLTASNATNTTLTLAGALTPVQAIPTDTQVTIQYYDSGLPGGNPNKVDDDANKDGGPTTVSLPAGYFNLPLFDNVVKNKRNAAYFIGAKVISTSYADIGGTLTSVFIAAITGVLLRQENEPTVRLGGGTFTATTLPNAAGDDHGISYCPANGSYWETTVPAGYTSAEFGGYFDGNGCTFDAYVNGIRVGSGQQNSSTHYVFTGLKEGDIVRLQKTGGTNLEADQIILRA